MQSLAEHMSIYYQYYTKRTNIIAHFIGIPVIIFSLMIITGWVKISVPGVFNLSLTWLLLTPLIIYYFFLDIILASLMIPALALMALIAGLFTYQGPTVLSVWMFVGCFAGGCIFQLIGHWFEGRHPALMDNIWQVLIGPLFILAAILFHLGYRKNLQAKIKQALASSHTNHVSESKTL